MPAEHARRRPNRQGAQSLVEFALILPLLALLLLGATDLARAFYYYIALEDASRATVKVLIDYPEEYSDTNACNAGHQSAQPYINISCGSGLSINRPASTTSNPPTRTPGRQTVTVTATYAFTPITILIQWFTNGTITLSASTTMLTWY